MTYNGFFWVSVDTSYLHVDPPVMSNQILITIIVHNLAHIKTLSENNKQKNRNLRRKKKRKCQAQERNKDGFLSYSSSIHNNNDHLKLQHEMS